ncbi:3-demethylubiquinone-9 3-methyltransferase [Caballeronia calidae]|uniref:3-demethylubiquinone-9 3-methyltransferase n=1 Tax=Caballeronia calidae TaxID=1777139 RepID=A0A158EJW7_9BURK|nr:class I SAM-dependent methyltransferase [Caballeronia calidae]SAL07145.1 3-demethylubiquinone-9 3-methyltransferase [Caballeronia calidae]
MSSTLIPGCTALRHCLACGSSRLFPYLDLGAQPLANSFVSDASKLTRYPLGTALCTDCYHSQLTHSVDPALLFKHYLYVSGTTASLARYFHSFARALTERHGQGLHILDIASNDGSFLAQCKRQGHSVQGVDPAENLRALSEANGIPTAVAFWNEQLARQLDAADVIVAMNVVAHVPDPLAFLTACAIALKPGGTLYIQTSQANIFKNCEFDTIYHEHHSFFTARSIKALAARAGFEVVSIDVVAVHGGSYLWELRHRTRASDAVLPIEQDEVRNGFYNRRTYEQFQAHALRIARHAQDVVKDKRRRGYTVGAYGAAAKGNTFVNFAALELDFMIDDNPLKHNLRSPGMNTPVKSAQHLCQTPDPMALLVLAWNFYDEVKARVRSARPSTPTILMRAFPQWEEDKVEIQ